ncbi:MAG: adenylyl-sulfate kinase [Nitrospirales bacterium]|nr:adenylyl-sulfate kinase [Nitrospira sp.]MDR4502678.1 adenylyl-sulfate kinase [Nitrospirales bacterium]
MGTEGFTVWFTGLPCSGKSTLAQMLYQRFVNLQYPTEILDGDEVRRRLTKGLGFSKPDRDENIRRIAYVAKLLTRIGGVTITAAISPYQKLRREARDEIGRFVEVYVQCPIDVCIKRDVKGHYAKAQRGEITNFTGVSDPYEPPENPEIVVMTDKESPEVCIDKILEYLSHNQYIRMMRKVENARHADNQRIVSCS